MAAQRSVLIETNGADRVASRAPALIVHYRKIEDRCCMPFLSCFAEPTLGQFQVSAHALAGFVAISDECLVTRYSGLSPFKCVLESFFPCVGFHTKSILFLFLVPILSVVRRFLFIFSFLFLGPFVLPKRDVVRRVRLPWIDPCMFVMCSPFRAFPPRMFCILRNGCGRTYLTWLLLMLLLLLLFLKSLFILFNKLDFILRIVVHRTDSEK